MVPFFQSREYPMKHTIIAFVLSLAGASLAVGLSTHDADAGGAKAACKQIMKEHRLQGKHHALMKQCKAAYKAYKAKTVAR